MPGREIILIFGIEKSPLTALKFFLRNVSPESCKHFGCKGNEVRLSFAKLGLRAAYSQFIISSETLSCTWIEKLESTIAIGRSRM